MKRSTLSPFSYFVPVYNYYEMIEKIKNRISIFTYTNKENYSQINGGITMGINTSSKTISTDQISCDGTLKITLALSASPDITTNPTDIVLILDRSGSMSGAPLTEMKKGAKTFIDIIDKNTDSTADGEIGLGSKIGIVSFSDTATKDAALITSVATLKDAVNAISAGGLTNHADAFTKAIELFDPLSTNQKVMIMFTDGKTTTGPLPSPIAAGARAAGITIYCIGLIGADGIDVAVLNDWATDPDSSHVSVTPDSADLEKLFEELANNLSKPGATNIIIDEIIHPDFSIVNIQSPTKGQVNLVSGNTLQWTIDSLGVSANEGASLVFTIRHIADTSGLKEVNQAIHYTDKEKNIVFFPSPKVNVLCDTVIYPEPCPPSKQVTVEGCEDSILFDLGDVYLESLGRILQFDVNLKNICPNKRTALAILLDEVDMNGHSHSRGMKIITVPAHQGNSCRDILVKCIKFIVPEDLDVSGGKPTSLCNPRNFKVKVFANSLDRDFECCS